MPSLKDLRNRIASVKATQKITKAMQMVAAAKLRRAQTAAESARPYAERMDRVLANLAASIGPSGVFVARSMRPSRDLRVTPRFLLSPKLRRLTSFVSARRATISCAGNSGG